LLHNNCVYLKSVLVASTPVPTAPSKKPSSKDISTPTTVPSSNIIESSYSTQTCKTVNGTFGTVSDPSLTPYVATFSYELETIPGTTSQTVENLILPALDQAFGDYVVPFVLHSSVLEDCSAVASLQQKWEFISKMVKERSPNQTIAEVQIEAETLWEEKDQAEEQQKSTSDNIAVGFSAAPRDRIDVIRQCSYKSKPENPCFIMSGFMTIFIQTGVTERRQLQDQEPNQTQEYQDSVEATMQQFMSDTDNYRNVSSLIARLSYVPEEPTTQGKPTTEESNDDTINRKLWLGLLAGLGGTLFVVLSVGIIIQSNKRTSEHVSLAQQHAEANADAPTAGSYVSPQGLQ
jgi:hypothetical protein